MIADKNKKKLFFQTFCFVKVLYYVKMNIFKTITLLISI